jgi:hypothetical protein
MLPLPAHHVQEGQALFRRRTAVAAFAASASCGCAWAQVFPIPVPRAAASQALAPGCGAGPGSSAAGPRPARLARSGVRELDDNLAVERDFLNKAFSVSPDFYFGDDTPQRPVAWTYRDPEGAATVVLGRSFIQREMELNPQHWQVAVIGVMAHEWAHALQYSSNLQDRSFMWETHADYMAGWYLGNKRAAGLSLIHPEPLARSLFEKGNIKDFFDPDAYGAPRVRVAAMRKGFEFGMKDHVRGFLPDVRTAANQGYLYALEAAR